MNELLELLKSMGMQEYESKAYAYLLENGVSTAEQISKLGDIPLPRVYDTLDSLHKKGVVEATRGRPKKYNVVSTESLKALIEDKKDKMKKEIEEAEDIYKKILSIAPKQKLRANPAEKQELWMVSGRKNIINSAINQQKKASKEILMFGEDMSSFSELSDILKKKIREGVNIKILCHINGKTKKIIGKALSIGIDIRELKINGLMGAVTDKKYMLLVTKIPRAGVNEKQYYGIPGNDKLFSYEAITTENPIMLNTLNTYFDMLWNTGKTPKEVFKKLN